MTAMSVKHPLPRGRWILKRVHFVTPGMVIYPRAWRGRVVDGHTAEWAVVVENPIHLPVETTGGRRWETRIPCRLPHSLARVEYAMEGKGDGTLNVLVPDAPVVVPVTAEVWW